MALKTYLNTEPKFKPKDVVIDKSFGAVLEITGYETEYTGKIYSYFAEVLESNKLGEMGVIYEVTIEYAHKHFVKCTPTARILYGK